MADRPWVAITVAVFGAIGAFAVVIDKGMDWVWEESRHERERASARAIAVADFQAQARKMVSDASAVIRYPREGQSIGSINTAASEFAKDVDKVRATLAQLMIGTSGDQLRLLKEANTDCESLIHGMLAYNAANVEHGRLPTKIDPDGPDEEVAKAGMVVCDVAVKQVR